MKKLIPIFLVLLAYSCKTDELLKPNASENSGTTNNEAQPQKGRSANARVGGHPYWYFYKGQSTKNLRSAYSDDGVKWSGDYMFNNNIGSSASPAAVIFDSKFYCIYKGGASQNIYFSSSTDGINWEPNTQIPSVLTQYAPTAVVAGGYLYVFYAQVAANHTISPTIYYTSTNDGVTWSQPGPISTDRCLGALTAVVKPWDPDNITLYYSAEGLNELRVRRTTNPVSGGTADFGDYTQLYDDYPDGGQGMIKTIKGVGVAFTPNGSGGYDEWIAYKSFDGTRLNIFHVRSEPYGDVYWTGAHTSDAPSMVYFDNKFTVVYKSYNSGAILFGISRDGMNWWSNFGAIGQTAAGGPSLVVE
jgi:hypothetical protein